MLYLILALIIAFAPANIKNVEINENGNWAMQLSANPLNVV